MEFVDDGYASENAFSGKTESEGFKYLQARFAHPKWYGPMELTL